ncbi:hypothetical protein [Clostridium ihumii]|uniref:hypothetical protein n=1 Tax=Clostridium ihumii TaxID=1470356 RepID=UPI00058BCDD7|nr:hypothetical protein [Clostridium ihumii]
MIEKYLKDALKAEYIISIPIENLSKEELSELSEKAKYEDILVTLRTEHSNVHQGVLICLIKKELVNEEFLKYL